LGEKRVSLRHEDGLRFVAATGSGHDIIMDNAAGDAGPRPTELVLAAIAGCTAMDVVEILAKKRQAVTRYATEVTGVQRETAPNVFTDITILHVVEGDVDTEAVRRAIELSATKYCTVSAQIASGVARISHRYLIRRPAGVANRPAEEEGEVVVTGPSKDVLAV
jgi:putative redox protein